MSQTCSEKIQSNLFSFVEDENFMVNLDKC